MIRCHLQVWVQIPATPSQRVKKMTRVFLLESPYGKIRFKAYEKEAPKTVEVFFRALPVKVKFVQARFSGAEIWSHSLKLKIEPENCVINFHAGEIGYAASNPRSEASQDIALVYGDAKLSDCVNLFGIVLPSDLKKLKKLGESIWLHGAKTLKFKVSNEV